MMLPMMPHKGLGLVPFEAVFFTHWMDHLYMAGWKVVLAAYGLGARSALSRPSALAFFSISDMPTANAEGPAPIRGYPKVHLVEIFSMLPSDAP